MKTNIDTVSLNFTDYIERFNITECTSRDIWEDSRLATINEVCKLIFPLYTDEELARAMYTGDSLCFLFTMVPQGLLRNELRIRGYYDKDNASSRN